MQGGGILKKVILSYEKNGISKITLNRPEVKNAVDFDVMNELNAIFDKLEEDKGTRILVFTGKGSAFCSGGDLGKFHSLKTEDEALGMLVPMSRLLKRIAALPYLTVAYINGHAVGGGCELAAACDFRVADPGAKTGFIQGRLQITTGWGGASLLKEKVPYLQALTLLTTARLFTAEEGLNMGWIQAVLNSESELMEWLSKWNGVSGSVLGSYKDAVRTEKERDTLFNDIDKEVKACAKLWAKDEHHDAVNAFLSKTDR
ncbi:enoyl-CoA hydratase/isomerase family protein [Alteribacter keqinensis]|uniref:Enoyl-CoA hydratase/isomerase family protein n=1 Tax=Alteribacter keqinensis TaxID=2483800 RepID=A0A3M7TWP8_9BACI|nr:enoyl-CoA hydratase/isomerase family protein [Alteribacter keqinensis]